LEVIFLRREQGRLVSALVAEFHQNLELFELMLWKLKFIN
jgi:hypothetical protein